MPPVRRSPDRPAIFCARAAFEGRINVLSNPILPKSERTVPQRPNTPVFAPPTNAMEGHAIAGTLGRSASA
jgi:hypothetical protein